MPSDELDDIPVTGGEGWGKFVTNMKTGSSQKGQMQREWATAKMRTVSFALIQKLAVGVLPAKVEALLTFSVKGNNIQRRMSVVNGSSISCISEAVDVSMEDKSGPSPGFPYVTGTEYQINVITAPGSRAFGHQAPVLQQQGPVVIGPGTAHDWPIPQDCGAVAVFISYIPSASPGPTDAQIVVTESSNGLTTRQSDGKGTFIWLPLSPGATNINIDNLSGVDTITVSLMLGIDG